MVVGASIQNPRMNVGARPPGKTLEEVIDEFSLQVAHQALAHFGIDNGRCAPAKIDRRQSQRARWARSRKNLAVGIMSPGRQRRQSPESGL